MKNRREADAYRSTWRRLRGARLAILIAFLAWLPLHALLRAVTGSGHEWLYVTVPLLIATVWGSSLAIGYARCPRCGEYFARHPLKGRRLLTTRCLHCGLAQWTVSDATSATIQPLRPT